MFKSTLEKRVAALESRLEGLDSACSKVAQHASSTVEFEDRLAKLRSKMKKIDNAGYCTGEELRTLWDILGIILRYMDEKNVASMDNLIASIKLLDKQGNRGEHNMIDSLCSWFESIRIDDDGIAKRFRITHCEGKPIVGDAYPY